MNIIVFLNITCILVYSYQWLRHYATSRKIAGSIPDEVIGFLN
jgi:hypothetical protein